MSYYGAYFRNAWNTGPDARRVAWTNILARACPREDLKSQLMATSRVSFIQATEMMLTMTRQSDIDDALALRPECITVEGAIASAIAEEYGTYTLNLRDVYSTNFLPGNPEFKAIKDDLAFSSLVRYMNDLWQWREDKGRKLLLSRLPWEARERLRVRFGFYKEPPWLVSRSLKPIPGHHAHISLDDPSKIAFTENPEKGARGITLRMKPGRYLTRFYPHLANEVVEEYQAEMLGNYTLKFAATPDEVQSIYCNGPRSCMSGPTSNYSGSVHPSRVYGDSDVQVAYLQLSQSSKIKARVLVWPEKKVVGRIYGDIERMKAILAQNGYDTSSTDGYALSGARIRKIWHNEDSDTLVLPYIDGPQAATSLNNEWLMIGTHRGEGRIYDACFTHGLSNDREDRCMCERCEELADEEDMTTVQTGRYDTQIWCSYCTETHATFCTRTHETVDDHHLVEVITHFVNGRPRREQWSEWYVEDYAYMCDGYNEYVADDIPMVSMHNGETWCEQWFEDHGVTVDGEHYPTEDAPALEEEAA